MSNTVRAGNTVRGWNDPPEFLHSTESDPNTPKKTTLLNKRVSHTLDGTVSAETDAENKATTLNEPPKIPISTTSDSNIIKEEQNIVQATPKTEVLIEEIESILHSKVELCKQNNLSTKICDDILKRIKIFVTNWPKLNENVKLKMGSLAKELENSQLSQANDLHVRLMLDYPSEVSQWMVGIKRLIHELINIEGNKNQHTE